MHSYVLIICCIMIKVSCSSPLVIVTSNPNFISQHFFHFSSFIHNGDNLNLQEKMKFHGEILKNLRFCEKKNFCHEFCIIHLKNCIDLMNNEGKCNRNWKRQEYNSPRVSKIFHNYQFDNLTSYRLLKFIL